MAEPFIGEVKLFSFNRPPQGWMPCDGRLLEINLYQALFSLLGIRFGGDGKSTFAVPDLRGRAPMHPAAEVPQGTKGGVEDVKLTLDQIPEHNHFIQASGSNGSVNEFDAAVLAAASAEDARLFAPAGATTQTLDPGMVASTGGGGAHDNCQPSLVGNYCIAVAGIYPSRD